MQSEETYWGLRIDLLPSTIQYEMFYDSIRNTVSEKDERDTEVSAQLT